MTNKKRLSKQEKIEMARHFVALYLKFKAGTALSQTLSIKTFKIDYNHNPSEVSGGILKLQELQARQAIDRQILNKMIEIMNELTPKVLKRILGNEKALGLQISEIKKFIDGTVGKIKGENSNVFSAMEFQK